MLPDKNSPSRTCSSFSKSQVSTLKRTKRSRFQILKSKGPQTTPKRFKNRLTRDSASSSTWTRLRNLIKILWSKPSSSPHLKESNRPWWRLRPTKWASSCSERAESLKDMPMSGGHILCWANNLGSLSPTRRRTLNNMKKMRPRNILPVKMRLTRRRLRSMRSLKRCQTSLTWWSQTTI